LILIALLLERLFYLVKKNNTGFELNGLYQFNLQHQIELGGSIFNESYDFLEGENDGSVPLSFDVDKFQINLKYEYNKIKREEQYISGFRSILNVQQVVSSEDILPDFIIGWNDFLYYKRLGRKGNLAGRLRLGLATNDNSPFAPFAVDNNLNIRGVGNSIDRGTGVFVLNAECRHTIYEKNWLIVQSNIFIDAGSWRNPGGDFSDFTNPDNFRIYPGVGFRFTHKKIHRATLRIDYGYGVTEDATQGLVFGIGQYF